jgi:NAD-dependent dihydropyrimidine dehydrogenase PreA subunit
MHGFRCQANSSEENINMSNCMALCPRGRQKINKDYTEFIGLQKVLRNKMRPERGRECWGKGLNYRRLF